MKNGRGRIKREREGEVGVTMKGERGRIRRERERCEKEKYKWSD